MNPMHYYLDGNANAVEFCPHGSFHHVLAAATYTLQDGIQPERLGSISIFSVHMDAGLDLLHHLRTAGIFDVKWNPVGVNLHPVLAQADADGCLRLHSLESGSFISESGGLSLKEIGAEKISSSMCLCLDWDPSAPYIALGVSDGSIYVVNLRESQIQVIESWKAHDFEVWATLFDAHRPHLLYTGSDDCRLSCWDLRANQNLVFHNSQTHRMGVCCISKSPVDANYLVTGSYDEFVRVWDVRSMKNPVNGKSISLGGGVWKIKHHPCLAGVLLAACMHNGFAVLNITGESIIITDSCNRHRSLAYGADWQRGVSYQNQDRKGYLVATCSFYDRFLQVWKPRI